MPLARSWKGKERAVDVALEGSGGREGIVLPLDRVGSGLYEVSYTLPIKFGEKEQQFSLQIDTGSSDMWVASTSCKTESCARAKGYLYDPSAARQTGQDFTIPYLQGKAAGPVVWDRVNVGGYRIDSQALAAADDVESEPLDPNFSGILGLALPLNSIIAQSLPPVTTNDPDGAAWASNLFSITPISNAPASRFLSLALDRPGSDKVPSVLGIGRHPSALVPDPSKVLYSTLVSDRAGILFWKATVRAITVYVNGEERKIPLGQSASGAAFPSAVIDSGVPLILTTTPIANAIYGALGIAPSNDGKYYVPCRTPLNMTFTIDDRPETSIHPLDLTAEPLEDHRADFCIGLIQVADAQLSRPGSSIGDMILGVPFMRNVYTVMAYQTQNTDGSFTPFDQLGPVGSSIIRPRLGLLQLTDPTEALKEFEKVRVLNQPISSSVPSSGTGSGSNTKNVNVGGKTLSTGVIALIAVSAFFGLCAFIVVIRWLVMSRLNKRAQKRAAQNGDGFGGLDTKAAFMLARRGDSIGASLQENMTEDELREMRYRAYLRKKRFLSDSTTSSDRTIDANGAGFGQKDEAGEDEFGVRYKRSSMDDTWDVRTPLAFPVAGDDTLVGTGKREKRAYGDAHAVPLVAENSPPSSPENGYFPQHRHRQQSSSDPVSGVQPHQPQQSVDLPLLPSQQRDQERERHHHHQPSYPPITTRTSYDEDLRYPPALPSQSPLEQHHRRPSSQSIRSPTSPSHRPSHPQEGDGGGDADELGMMSGVSMAGVGSAARRKMAMDAALRDSNRIDGPPT